jgi:hypothetical protein
VNRRDILKGSVAGVISAGAAWPSSAGAAPSSPAEIERWGVFEAKLQGPAGSNPFTEVDLHAAFRQGNRTVSVRGFYDGDGIYRVRFMPDAEGDWTYTTASSRPELDGHRGGFRCIAPGQGNHGPVMVRDTFHFCYADGTPYHPFGTTCYAWVHQTKELQQQTLSTLKSGPFNKIRMCVFPKSYEYNHNEPPFYPFPRDAAGTNDLSRFNPEFFRHIEKRIQDLSAIGLQADLILFHPYDRWGYAKMPAEVNDRYLRYVVARFGAYRNVWWSLANEYDFIKALTTTDWLRFARIIEEEDAAHHLRSIHHGHTMYDYSEPWVTHASLQTTAFDKALGWRAEWRKPVIFDELQYEGNIPQRWGNVSGEEEARRFWRCIVAGCYATHGETYLNAEEVLWWSKGGTLHGSSPERIGFLRRLVEEVAPRGFAGADSYYLSATSYKGNILYFTDEHQPVEYKFPLPADETFRAEIIDPWAMTSTPLSGTFSGATQLKLPGKPRQAVLFRKVS